MRALATGSFVVAVLLLLLNPRFARFNVTFNF
jgi:hypothetical protein